MKLQVNRTTWLLLLALALAIAWTVIFWRNAWVCDDAYITFRSVEQLHAGNGPRWNPHARVQAFTHPLWFGVLAAARVISSAPGWNALALSFFFSTSALALLAARLMGRPASLLVLFAGAISSKAFVDYSASGLENPLVFALLAVFLALLSRTVLNKSTANELAASKPTLGELVQLIFVASLILLCRHDLLLIVAPPIAVLAWRRRFLGARRLLVALLIGSAPFLVWTAFSVLYYGFPFPNTAYAKLNTGVGAAALWRQGLWYFENALRWDPLTLIVCLLGPLLLVRSRHPALVALGAGCFFHLFYIARIGGDFMAGRFLTPVFFLGLTALSVHSLTWSRRAIVGTLAGLAMLTSTLPSARLLVDTTQDLNSYLAMDLSEHGISDEKRVWSGHGLLRGLEKRLQGQEWQARGAKARDAGAAVIHTAVGWDGFHAGIETTVIDVYALADPLLARLPAAKPWRIGHFARAMPAGYAESVAANENRILNPQVYALYERIRLITEGPLLSRERFKAIIAMNLTYRRPSCAAPPCRYLRTRWLEMNGREKIFDLGTGAVEALSILPAEESGEETTRHTLVLTGWLPDVDAELLLVAGVPIKQAKVQNAWHQEIVKQSAGTFGPLAGIQLTATFDDPQKAAEAARTACLLARLKPHDKDGDWQLIPRADGQCSELQRE